VSTGPSGSATGYLTALFREGTSDFDGSNAARLFLAAVFADAPDQRWKRLWRSMIGQLPLEDE
jgi:hypothetical protein